MLSADDKLGMSLDEIIKTNKKRGNIASKRVPRFQKRIIKSRNRTRNLSTRIQARSNVKSLNSKRVAVNRMNLPLVNKLSTIESTPLSLTTPHFRERQRQQNALVSLARRLTKRKIVQLKNLQRQRNIQIQPIFTNMLNRNTRRLINPVIKRQSYSTRKAYAQSMNAMMSANNNFNAVRVNTVRNRDRIERSRIFLKNNYDGGRRFVNRQLADVAADRFTRRRFSDIRDHRSAYVTTKYQNERRSINFDDGRSVFRRTPNNSSVNRRIKAERQYDRFYSDDEPESIQLGSLYADKLPQRRRRVADNGSRNRRLPRKYDRHFAADNSTYDIYRRKRRFF
ncbi:hypothetical protein GJ496_005309 [Pomphorhynchus laevis]|nr:hypothetical protein GJ496_005309 [Pomphorhynchus laevis]